MRFYSSYNPPLFLKSKILSLFIPPPLNSYIDNGREVSLYDNRLF